MSDTIKTWGVGTYAYTQLINHLNQEKASLLEKIEHYERELQMNSNKTTNWASKKSKQIGFEYGYLDNLDDFNSNEKSYDFYYERNIRP